MNKEQSSNILEKMVKTVEFDETVNVNELYEAVRVAVETLRSDHFPDPTKMIPLTLEQLRKMRGKWVWLVISGEDGVTGWAFVSGHEISTFFGYDSDKHVVKATFSFEENGKEFFAYAYPPAHIDREAWTAEWRELHGDKMVGPDDCGDDVYRHYHYSVCTSCGKGSAVKSNFCPVCGKAMTPEACAELEKRTGG